MRILFDINHPAHVHFFRFPIELLQANGHEVLITSRDKEVTLALLDGFDLEHIPLSAQAGGGFGMALRELLLRDRKLFQFVKTRQPDILASVGGTFIAHVGALTGTPSLIFYDTENARMQNAITYPLASRIFVPRCYGSWLPKKRALRYSGYHELSYLRPERFRPDIERARAAGLAPVGETFLLRIVSWQANHDIGEQGWSGELLRKVVDKLASLGRVLISSEASLDDEFSGYLYRGNPSDMHDLLAYCSLCVGESATVASECAVLGVPAIYVAKTGRGYTDEQEQRYGLVKNLRVLEWRTLEAAIDEFLARDKQYWQRKRRRLLNETLDVASMVATAIETFPASPPMLRQAG